MTSNTFGNMRAKLKKFGLAYDDFRTMIENVAILLRIITINIQENWTERVNLIFYTMTAIALLGYSYVYIFSMIWVIAYRYAKNDLEAASVIIALSSCSLTCLTKFIFMKLYAKDIKNTVANFLKCDSQVVVNTRFAKNLRKELRLIKRRASTILIILVTNALIYLIIPLVRPGRHFSVDVYILYGLEPVYETPNYELATFILTVSTGFSVYTMVGVAVYIIVIVGYIEAQLLALSEELRNIWNDSQNFYNNMKHRITDKREAVSIKQQVVNEFIRIRLRDVVKFHIANINLMNELNYQFRPTLAVEYILLGCAIIAELLGGIERAYLSLPYTFFQILMDCLAGQRLIDASDVFESSVYSCKWENFDSRNQRTVLLMLKMSQKTLGLSAGGIAILNYNFLMIILKTSYSTFTTLQSTVNKYE